MTAPRAPSNRAEVAALIAEVIAGGPQHSVEIVASWMEDADAILAALDDAGVRLVPAAATREIRDALAGPGRMEWRWEDALAASPYAPEGGRR